MRTKPVSRCTLVFVVVVTLTAAGCAISVDWPKNDADRVCPPVQVVVNWQGGMSNFAATLDGADITSQFFVSYSNRRASAQLSTTAGTHTLVVRGEFQGLFGPSTGNATRTFVVPGIGLSTSPTSLQIPKNSSAQLAVIASGCAVPVNVTLPSLPSGVTANPASFTINVPGPSNPGISGAASASGSTTIQTSASATTGKYTISVNGTGSGQSASTSFTLDLGTPTLNSVTPNMQVKGGTVTLTGSGFDPACANNTLTLGGLNVTPPICSPAGTSLSFQIPLQAKYGTANVTVTVGGLTSGGKSLIVARNPGSFVDTTAGVLGQISSNRSCSNGTITVGVAKVGNNSYQATYKRGSTAIGSAIPFALDSFNPSALNYGGAGFSMCTAGLVLDAGGRRLNFLNFDTGATAANIFFFLTGTGTFMSPQIFTAPDGTIVLFLTALTNQNFNAVFIDLDQTQFGTAIATTQVCVTAPVAAINASNEIELSCGSGSKTTFPIP